MSHPDLGTMDATQLRQYIIDLEEALEDKRRLARELDVALNGMAAATQASLCDLVSQVQRLRLALSPPCCHVSGMHDPTHFSEGRYVCNDQKAKAYDSIRAALCLPPVATKDCTPVVNCCWCNPFRER